MMQTQIHQVEDVCVVNFNGHIDFESADGFKALSPSLFKNKKVIFNMKGLSFVGSCGVIEFLESLVHLSNQHPHHTKICGVGSEFLKVFEAKGLHQLQIYDSQTEALQAMHEGGHHPAKMSQGEQGGHHPAEVSQGEKDGPPST